MIELLDPGLNAYPSSLRAPKQFLDSPFHGLIIYWCWSNHTSPVTVPLVHILLPLCQWAFFLLGVLFDSQASDRIHR